MNQDTSYEHVVDLGGGEEYFASDYDQVHCRHGAYVGYPGGADHLCFECEMGYNTIHEVEVYEVYWGDRKMFDKWNKAEAYGFVDNMNALRAEDKDIFQVKVTTRKVWGPADE